LFLVQHASSVAIRYSPVTIHDTIDVVDDRIKLKIKYKYV